MSKIKDWWGYYRPCVILVVVYLCVVAGLLVLLFIGWGR